MAQDQIDYSVFVKLKQTIIPKHVVGFSIVLISIILTFSIFDAILFLLSYAFGFVLFYFILKYKTKIVSLLLKLLISIKKSDVHVTTTTFSKFQCNVCEGNACSRYSIPCHNEPWSNIFIHKQLDQSIENFYNIILKLFITPWYSKLTKEDTLLVELRYLLRYASSLLINRALRINVGQLITSKLIPCAIKHYAICEEAQKVMLAEGLKSLDEAALKGPLKYSLHPALINRECELEYLRCITEILLPNLLPKQEVDSKLFNILIREIFAGWVLLSLTDVLADPNIINLLVILATGEENMSQLPELPNHNVAFLENFVKNSEYKRMRLLNLEVSEILKTPEYLYSFMQFMKSRGKIHLLQFCLDIDDFNKKMLQPELNLAEQDALYDHACKLYSMYFSHDSSSCISFESKYLEEFNSILKEGPENINKLQRCKVIYESYDYVFSLLDKEWAPKFFDSKEFYKLIIPDVITEPKKSSTNSKCNSSVIGKPLSKLKDAFKSQAIEGQLLEDDLSCKISNEMDSVDLEMQYSNILANYTRLKNKDMTTWRVSIEDVTERKAKNKAGYLDWFTITINKIDPHGMGDDSQWNVDRNDRDFHKLKDKLIEFHGEVLIGDIYIPPKKVKAAAKIRKMKYEVFLQQLLGIPLLRSSDLLHMFLTADADFLTLAEAASSDSSSFPDFGSFYQSVTHKLRKEKGQHLDNFLQTYLISTDVEYYQSLNEDKKKNSDVEEEATDVMNDSFLISSKPQFHTNTKCLTNGVFGNNFNLFNMEFRSCSFKEYNPTWNFSQSLSLLLKDVFHVRNIIVSISEILCETEASRINDFIDSYINQILSKVLSQPRLGHLIKLGQDLLFNNTTTSTTKTDQHGDKYEKAKTQLRHAFPQIFIKIVGANFINSSERLLNFLQNPKLNKHLTYTLLDIILIELFPELEKVIKKK